MSEITARASFGDVVLFGRVVLPKPACISANEWSEFWSQDGKVTYRRMGDLLVADIDDNTVKFAGVLVQRPTTTIINTWRTFWERKKVKGRYVTSAATKINGADEIKAEERRKAASRAAALRQIQEQQQ